MLANEQILICKELNVRMPKAKEVRIGNNSLDSYLFVFEPNRTDNHIRIDKLGKTAFIDDISIYMDIEHAEKLYEFLKKLFEG